MTRATRLAAVLVFGLVSGADAQEWAQKMFSTTSHSFGTVARGAKVEFHFRLKNIYVEDVHIAGVRSSCGCTTPTISKDTLKTYEESSIVAAFNTSAFTGQKSATVTVTIDKPYYAEVQLHVDGFIRSDVVLEPGSADLGTLDLNAGGEQKLLLNYAGSSTWAVTEVRSSNPHLSGEVRELSRSGGGVKYELTVRLAKEAPLGFFRDQLTLLTNDGGGREIPVDVEARIVGPLTANPGTLYFGALETGQKATKQLVVQGKRPFKIVGFECAEDCFDLQAADAAKPVHVIPVTYTAGPTSGKKSHKLVLRTDLGEEIVCEVQVFAQVLAPAATANAQP